MKESEKRKFSDEITALGFNGVKLEFPIIGSSLLKADYSYVFFSAKNIDCSLAFQPRA